MERVGSRLLWVVFTLLVVLIAHESLRACKFSFLSSVGLISHCPSVLLYKNNTQSLDESLKLNRELQSLELELTALPNCPEDIKPTLDKILEGSPVEVQRAAQLIVILDDSGSMLEDAVSKTNTVYEEWQSAHEQLADLIQGKSLNELSPSQEAKVNELYTRIKTLEQSEGIRFTVAKNAIGDLFEYPAGIPRSLWSFNGCDKKAVRHISNLDSSGFREKIAAIGIGGLTPIASTIEQIPDMLIDGAGKDANNSVNVILFTDGTESCNSQPLPEKDPCDAARNLRANYPFVTIHSVSLADNVEAVRCTAEATGGLVAKSSDQKALAGLLQYISDASQQ